MPDVCTCCMPDRLLTDVEVIKLNGALPDVYACFIRLTGVEVVKLCNVPWQICYCCMSTNRGKGTET